MKDILLGVGITIVFIAKLCFKIVHIFFSSIYQSYVAVNDQFRRDIKQWKSDDNEFLD